MGKVVTVPSSITIKGRDWSIKPHDNGHGIETEDGTCDYSKQLITVSFNPCFHDQYLKEILVHELMHAAWATAEISELPGLPQWAEETIVSLLSPVVQDIIEKNPKLIKYLTT